MQGLNYAIETTVNLNVSYKNWVISILMIKRRQNNGKACPHQKDLANPPKSSQYPPWAQENLFLEKLKPIPMT